MDIVTALKREDINRREMLRLGLVGTAIGMGGTLLIARPSRADDGGPDSDGACKQVEPNAGSWKTWVLASGSDLRLPPPPSRAATQRELETLESLVNQRDVATRDRIKFWDAGAAYRWAQLATDRISKGPVTGLVSSRPTALVLVAIYDATIATWDSKYTYNRPRPSQVHPRLATVISNPRSPSYPSEHAAIAGAATAVLAYLYPSEQAAWDALAEEDGHSRLIAGVEYPSDVAAGLQLGRAVGAAMIARARTDGFDRVWTGTIPTIDPTGRGEPLWNGTNPAAPLAGTWKTWVLASGDQFRPPPYPNFFSAEGAAELNQVLTFDRALNGANFSRNAEAFFAQTPQGGLLGEVSALQQRIQEERLEDNPPRTARVHALSSIAKHDAAVACFDGKYFYWRIRPFQAHLGLQTLFPTPNHPSYPAAHGAGSGAGGAMAAYLFPRDAAMFTDEANQLAQSRLWAGIHYQSDIDAGLALGRRIAQAVIDRANADGSQSAGAAAAKPEVCEMDR